MRSDSLAHASFFAPAPVPGLPDARHRLFEGSLFAFFVAGQTAASLNQENVPGLAINEGLRGDRVDGGKVNLESKPQTEGLRASATLNLSPKTLNINLKLIV